ncbi:MAG: hypothetical protein WCO51_08230 [bacterium]
MRPYIKNRFASPKKTRGAILIMTMIMLLLVTLMGVGVLTVTVNGLHMGQTRTFQATSFNLAESGAEMAALWVRNQSTPPSQTSPFDPFNGAQSLGAGTYRVTITPDPANATQYLKSYTITSVGTVNGNTKTVQLVIQQATFGKFAYFTDQESSSITNGAIWWKTGDICDGPAHTNSANGSKLSINYTNSSASIFKDLVTVSGSSIAYNPSTPSNETTFKKIYENGSRGYQLGMPTIALPNSTDAQKNAAWGASTGFPTTTGVSLKSSNSGGIYIYGDCTMALSVDTSGRQVFTIKQGTSTSTVTVDVANGSSTLLKPDGSTVSGPITNGAVYCTGNITSLKGEVADNKVTMGAIATRSAWTIATDVNAGKNITIADNLVYRTRPDKTKSSSDAVNLAAGTLGLVANNVVIASTAPQNLEIDAVMTAGGQNTTTGSFYVTNYDTKTPTGTLKLLGGVIQKKRGPVGTFNSSTGTLSSGYSKNYSYDPRLAINPPPFYPTTGTYQRLSWKTVTSQ